MSLVLLNWCPAKSNRRVGPRNVCSIKSSNSWQVLHPTLPATDCHALHSNYSWYTVAIAESLIPEVSPFNIRVLIVAPGAFRTEGMYSIPFNIRNPISDYDNIRLSSVAKFAAVPGNEPGDPVKAMEVLVDTVRGEGSAKGKAWPTWLLLGQDAENDLRARWDKFRIVLEGWRNIIASVWF